ncbi:MAG: hypothetical protein ACI9QD_001098 [Thermoproteota archaeon]|jgi:hypothetical protein
MNLKKYTLVLIAFAFTQLSFAEFKTSGELIVESRFFTSTRSLDSSDLSYQETYGYGLSARVEGDWDFSNFSNRFRIFSRTDYKDQTRDQFIIEELYTSYARGDWSIRIGHQLVNWSATEAFHPADIINSRNFDSSVSSPEKIGEFMFNFEYTFGEHGTLTFLYMPYYHDPLYPTDTNRQAALSALGYNRYSHLWLERNGELDDDNLGTQFALKYDYTFKSADFSFFYTQMNDRFVTGKALYNDGSSLGGFSLIFVPVDILGFTYQQEVWDFVFKVEAAQKSYVNPDQKFTNPGTVINVDYDIKDHTTIALGIDYGLIHSGGMGSTFIFEFQKVIGATEDEAASLNYFQSDILVGYRLDFNDAQKKELFFSIISDIDRDSEMIVSASYAQRLNDIWGLSTGLRVIDAPQKGGTATNLENLHESSNVYANLTRYF